MQECSITSFGVCSRQSLRTVLRLEQDVRLAVEESDRLRVKLEERESSHKLCTAEMEQQLRHWAQQLGAECQQLHFLVEQRDGELPQRYVSCPDAHTYLPQKEMNTLMFNCHY